MSYSYIYIVYIVIIYFLRKIYNIYIYFILKLKNDVFYSNPLFKQSLRMSTVELNEFILNMTLRAISRAVHAIMCSSILCISVRVLMNDGYT